MGCGYESSPGSVGERFLADVSGSCASYLALPSDTLPYTPQAPPPPGSQYDLQPHPYNIKKILPLWKPFILRHKIFTNNHYNTNWLLITFILLPLFLYCMWNILPIILDSSNGVSCLTYGRTETFVQILLFPITLQHSGQIISLVTHSAHTNTTLHQCHI